MVAKRTEFDAISVFVGECENTYEGQIYLFK